MLLRKLFVGLFIVLLIIVTGCSNNISTANEDQFIIVQKNIGKEYESNFEEIRKITDGKQVHKVKEILKELKWEYPKRDTLQPADYHFVFQPKDPKIKAEAILYKIWITPGRDRLVIGQGENWYAFKLTNEQSAILFEIITGDKLSMDAKTLVIEKNDGKDHYQNSKTITDKESIKYVSTILENAPWEDASVSMTHPPDFKINNLYEIWIGPQKNSLEVVIEGKNKYAKLSEKDSKTLFKIITGKTLGES